jgi:hypothetical protein
MVPVTALAVPIVVSAVFVFVASFIMHMLLPYHRNDYGQLPDEEKLLAALRAAAVKRGLYVFPYCTHKDMKSPALAEKQKLGPVGFMTIAPSGPPAMAKFLIQWFVYCFLIGCFVAYLAGHTIVSGASYLAVFRVAGTAAFMAYGLGNLSGGIWKCQPWGMTIKEAFDGLIFGLLTAGTFGWLWPR